MRLEIPIYSQRVPGLQIPRMDKRALVCNTPHKTGACQDNLDTHYFRACHYNTDSQERKAGRAAQDAQRIGARPAG